MSDIDILFTIGAQYDTWEFVLEEKGEVKIREYNYEVYEFPGFPNNVKLFNKRVEKVLLYFNADILERVDYYLDTLNYPLISEKLIEIQYEHDTNWDLETSNGNLVVINSRKSN